MKDFKHWGVKLRALPDYNYKAIWNNLKTIRLGESVDDIIELPPSMSEFYDVGLNTMCNAECSFCYVSATHSGVNYPNICEIWKAWMEQYPIKRISKNITTSLRPFQIAIGSTGEPCIHPKFTDFLQTVYETEVVPNYTTNGIILSKNDDRCKEILEATKTYCGGVAVSFGNKTLRKYALKAITNLLLYGDCKVMIHHIISDKESVDDFIKSVSNFGKDIHYHVLLPLMPHGRSNKGLEDGVFEYLQDEILSNDIHNVAFGANFYKYLENSKIPVSVYPQEAYSKNVILNEKVVITPSSFNLNPIETIKVDI